MSLFSRLDRVRDKAKLEAEEGVFAVPDLGPRDGQDGPRRAAKPAVSEPPATEAPVAQPPVSEPPMAQAPVVGSPVAEIYVPDPPAAQPPVAEIYVPEPVVAEPTVAETPIAEPPALEVPFPATTPSLDSALITPPLEAASEMANQDEEEPLVIQSFPATTAPDSVLLSPAVPAPIEDEEQLVIQSYIPEPVAEPANEEFEPVLNIQDTFTEPTVEVPASPDTASFAPVQLSPSPEPEESAAPQEEAAPEPEMAMSEAALPVETVPAEITSAEPAAMEAMAEPEVPAEPEPAPAAAVRSPFDRLMAANAEAENAEARAARPRPVPAIEVSETSVAEPPVSGTLPWEEPASEVAAEPEASTPLPWEDTATAQPTVSEAPVAAASAEPLPDFLSSATPAEPAVGYSEPASQAATSEAAVPEAAVPEAAAPEVVVPEAVIPEVAAPEAVVPEVATPEVAAPPQPPVVETAPPLNRPAPVAVTRERPINPGTEARFPINRLNIERPTMENPVPDRPAVERPTADLAPTERPFNDRFAGRAALDRDLEMGGPLARTPEAPSSPEYEQSRSPLARVESDAAQSEREAKNRAIYRRKHLMFDSVLGSIDPRQLQNPTRDGLRPAIEKGVDGALREFNLSLEPAERNWLIEEFLRETTDFGPLVSLLDDPGVNKILVSGSSDVTIEKLGRMERTGISFRDDDHLLSIIRRLAETVGGRIDAKVPLLDRPLPDGARVRAKIPPMAPQPTLTLEKSTGNPFVVLKRQQAERGRGDNLPYAQLRERIQQRLVREFEGDSLSMGNTDRLRGQVEEMINAVILEERVAVTRAERAALVMDLLNEIVGLGPIEPLLNDPEVDEVMVNGPYQIYVERKGKLELSPQRFRDNNHVMQVIDRIVAPLGRRIDEKSPMVDGRLRDGSRFNAIIPPLALSGPTMTIRKFARDPFTMTDLINFGTLTRDSAQFLQAAVEGRLNIVVSGGTGSGKTTTLNVLSSFIPASERIVTIEDAAELQLRQEHVIRLETRPPNIEGIGEVGIRDLVRNSLRMRPDRIVVGECRGGEALDMLQAMNTGHDGSLTTGHSNGPRDTLKRLETMVMMAGFDLPVRAIREQISMAVHMIVHQERMRDGKRRITAITELVGMEGDVITMQDIFRFEQERIDDEGRIIGALVPTGLRPKNFDTIIDNGVELSMELFHPRPMGEHGVRSRLDQRMTGR